MIFLDLEWHDSEIIKIEIEKSLTSKNDNITLVMRWPDDTMSRVIFANVILARLEMNFGCYYNDSISASYILDNQKTYDMIRMESMLFFTDSNTTYVGYVLKGNSNITIICSNIINQIM